MIDSKLLLGKLVILRHGETDWNLEQRFTGWCDIPLNSKGIKEGLLAGEVLSAHGIRFDKRYSSQLKRAIDTQKLVASKMDESDLAVNRTRLLNERHFGVMQGMSKMEANLRFGKPLVRAVRTDPYTRAPARENTNVSLFVEGSSEQEPTSESFEDTVKRVFPLWNEEIKPLIRAGEKVLVVSHSEMLRALMVLVLGIDLPVAMKLKIFNGIPKLYRFESEMKAVEEELSF